MRRGNLESIRSDPQGLHQRGRRAQQHQPDGALSWRRAARSDLSHRAADRRCVAGTWSRSDLIPKAYINVVGVLSNTNPTAPYRGAGRPEAIYLIERLIDDASRELGVDPI